MCENYKSIPTLENPHDTDQLAFLDDDLNNFQFEESEPDMFDKVDAKTNLLADIQDLINRIVELSNTDNLNDLSYCLENLCQIFTDEIDEDIDEFLEETNLVQILFNLLDYKNGISIGTLNSIYILNILAHITKVSPESMEKICQTFIGQNDQQNSNQNSILLLKELLRSPDFMPRIISIFLLSIDGSTKIIEDLILNQDIISILTNWTLKLKFSGVIFPEFIGPLSSLISYLFDHIYFEGRFLPDRTENHIIIKFEGQKVEFPIKIDDNEYNAIKLISGQLQTLINTIEDEIPKSNQKVNLENLCPLLEILAKYIECFATPENIHGIMYHVINPVTYLFTNPLNIDTSGKVFNLILAIYDQIIRVDPNFFKNDFEFIDVLFDYIQCDTIRLDIFLFLSNIVKYKEAQDYILGEQLFIKYNFLNNLDDFTYQERENALIILLTMIYYRPEEFRSQIEDNIYEDIIYDSIENAMATANEYFVQMFLCTLNRLYSNLPSMLEDIDDEMLVECISELSTRENLSISQQAELIQQKYFPEIE